MGIYARRVCFMFVCIHMWASVTVHACVYVYDLSLATISQPYTTMWQALNVKITFYSARTLYI